MPYSSDDDSNFSDTNSGTEVNHLSDSEDNTKGKKSTKCSNVKKNITKFVELFDDHATLLEKLIELTNDFTEKEKDFEKIRKDYNTERKKVLKELESHYKKMSKQTLSKLGKKQSKGGGSGGFNKPTPVPKVLKNFLEIDEDELPRPKVASLLHQKFKDLGYKDNDDKKLTIIKDKKVAKLLGVEKNFEITFASFQKFLAKFYNAEKESSNA